MGETTRGLGNQYAPHGDLDVRDARGQATTQKRATSGLLCIVGPQLKEV